ncbi:MAG TPA: hypothetical protein VJU60_09280 [Thermoleophilaceae bacterium]|nr:hypothetical protein [Thermoleophilaceae bacterium]
MRGAYGFRFTGEPSLLDRLPPVPAGWPEIRLRQIVGVRAGRAEGAVDVGDEKAELLVPGARLVLGRREALATVVAPQPLSSDRLLHPTLGYIASTFSHWLGRLAFHGGAFSAGDGAVALLGERGDGKSSTLAWLAGAGCPPLTDDVVVLDGLTAFAGPRSIDLWPDAARALGVAHHAHSVRDGERERLVSAAVPPQLPLRAWVSLAWGEGPRLRPLTPSERYAALGAQLHVHRRGRLPGDEALLDLLALPAFELVRPRSLRSLAESGSILLDLGERVAQGRSPADPKTGALEGSG